MRLNMNDRARINRLAAYHRWFAWHPVIAGDELIWLEYVERKGAYDHSKNTDRKPKWVWIYNPT